MTLQAGSLCSGVDGLSLGLERALGARTVWQSEIDPHASTVLAHHWPAVPNLGDLRTVDWASLGPVDVMCFGFPCQDISSAGRKAGLEGDKSVLWFDCADAVRLVRPRYLLVENVSALLVRGFGAVLGDLAEMGYDTAWGCLRSSDVGAPHRRERIFIAAALDSYHAGRPGGFAGHADPSRAGRAASPDAAEPGWRARYPDARAGRGANGSGATQPGGLGSTPSDAENDRQPGCRPAWGRGTRPADSGPVPACTDGQGQQGPKPTGRHELSPWGRYEAAVRRWELIIGRPAPDPRDDRGRLNPELPEWMLGYPHGWVTDPELGLPRTAQLRVLGNSCQPQVVELAARTLLLPLVEALEQAA